MQNLYTIKTFNKLVKTFQNDIVPKLNVINRHFLEENILLNSYLISIARINLKKT